MGTEAVAAEAAALRQAGLPLAALDRLMQADGGERTAQTAERAAALRSLRRHHEAVAVLEEAVGQSWAVLDPRLWAELSFAYRDAGRLSDALAAAQRAYALLPPGDGSTRAHLDLHTARLHVAAHAWPQAASAARQALHAAQTREAAERAEGLLWLGMAESHRSAKSAAQHLIEAIEMADGIARHELAAAGRLALTQWHLGRQEAEAALRHFDRALDAFWDDAGLWDRANLGAMSQTIGQLYQAAGHRSEALHSLNRAVAYFSLAGYAADGRQACRELAACLSGPAAGWLVLDEGLRQRMRRVTAFLTLVDSLASLRPDLDHQGEVVARYARSFAEVLGLAPETRTALAFAARLCEVGRTLEAGSFSPGPHHTEAGEALLASLPLPAGVARAVRHHHERWDGRGYPDGLEGPSIPLESRVLAIIASYVGRASRLPGDPEAHRAALAHLRTQAGAAFDPDLVAAFLAWHARPFRS